MCVYVCVCARECVRACVGIIKVSARIDALQTYLQATHTHTHTHLQTRPLTGMLGVQFFPVWEEEGVFWVRYQPSFNCWKLTNNWYGLNELAP